MKKSYGLSLHSLEKRALNLEMIKKYNDILFSFFTDHHIYPTYWSVRGKGFSKKLTKFTDRKLLNLENNLFQDKNNQLISGISYCINDKNSDAPSYDSYFDVSFIYTEYNKTLRLSLLGNPKYLKFDLPYKLIYSFIEIFEVD